MCKNWCEKSRTFATPCICVCVKYVFVYLCACAKRISSFAQADGWVVFQRDLDERGFVNSRFFTVFFIFIGNMIFTNLFIGVIIQVCLCTRNLITVVKRVHFLSTTQNLDEAQEEEKVYQRAKRSAVVKIKKDILSVRQKEDIRTTMVFQVRLY